MAITHHERVGKALELLRSGLAPFVEREFVREYDDEAATKAREFLRDERGAQRPLSAWDAGLLLRLMWDAWNAVLCKTLGRTERALVGELRVARTRWAQLLPFSLEDTYRVLDSAERLVSMVSASEGEDLGRLKLELLRWRCEEQARTGKRKGAGTPIQSQVVSTFPPWRAVAPPHEDVASGRYQQGEFAADLWQVHRGEGVEEHRTPAQFFRRTHLTWSLSRLLAAAAQRLAGKDGDAVVQLRAHFGGGKSHAMLALYHLASGSPPGDLMGVERVLKEADVTTLPAVKRVVLVGNRISPGHPVTKPDGTVVRTLWGELAWQLGGRSAFLRVQAADEKAQSPGDLLRELLNEHGPCLILVDEWVAYARQLHEPGDLPAGGFETHCAFAQALADAVRSTSQCLLVISLPASDAAGLPSAHTGEEEVGGERGRAALGRLRKAVGRVAEPWRPVSAGETLEIVRRRLFAPLVDQTQLVARQTVAKAFADLYRSQPAEFPPDCGAAEYERRLEASYPIHPEVLDRLEADWSALGKFQGTRSVLRVLAAVLHSLRESGDNHPLILPAHIPFDDPHVQHELTRCLPEDWLPVIAQDVDGPDSLPTRLDAAVPGSGRFSACRRVARTICLGSAATAAANRGLDEGRIRLGCLLPGETPAVFGDALRRLWGTATYLYQDGARYWYSTQPTAARIAEDRAEELRRDPSAVAREIEQRVRVETRQSGAFNRVHPLPHSGADVPDDRDARLVVLGIDQPYGPDGGSPAEAAARAIWESRGDRPRIQRNTLVFLAADASRLEELDQATRRFLAWESVVGAQLELDLTPHQIQQAELQRASADSVVAACLLEAYQWLLVPVQASPQAPLSWASLRLSGAGPLAERASQRLCSDELLFPVLTGMRLRKALDVLSWRGGDHVVIQELAEDFARHVHLPRLKDPAVLMAAIRNGLGLLSWAQDSFAYAEAFDRDARRYRGLRCGVALDVDGSGLLVRPAVAQKQRAADVAAVLKQTVVAVMPMPAPSAAGATPPVAAPRPVRFSASAPLDQGQVARDAGRIADAVLAHLAGLAGARVQVTLQIEAQVPGGVPEKIVRVVMENGRALKFTGQGFAKE